MRGGGSARWLAIGAAGVLAVGVVALSLAALDRAHPVGPSRAMAPAPTFTLGVTVPEATPTDATIPADQQRLLSTDATLWWRATAGSCGGDAPVIERSSDAGATWTNVTPGYLGIEKVLTLDGFASADAEVVAGMSGCNAQALRTYTRGQFWESYPEVLSESRFVDPKDAASVHLPTGSVAAPCDDASGLHAKGDVVALLCDDLAWAWDDGAWQRLAPEGAVALATDGSDIFVAYADTECTGVSVARVSPPAAESADQIGCVVGADPAEPVAISASGNGVLMWSGDALVPVG